MDLTTYIPSVDYADFLRKTLPYNASKIGRVVVVTTPSDHETIDVAREHGAQVHRTEAWTADGAHFNCARAIEEALDAVGRNGWIMQLSADIALPASFPGLQPEAGHIYSAPRRMKTEWPSEIPNEGQWDEYPYHDKQHMGLSGYLLLWHADDPHLPTPPWQPITWKHVGGSDSEFIARWPKSHQVLLPCDVLHLGVAGVDWCGRVQPYRDGQRPEMAQERAELLESTLYRRRRLRRRGFDDPHGHEKVALP